MHIAIVTAGGAGMFCGSCMHDNTLARSLLTAGANVSLLPTYTPIRVDEQDLSEQHVWLGGVNLYLDVQSRLWRRLPRMLTRWLDRPAVIRQLTRFGLSNDGSDLGPLTLALLKGADGPTRREVLEFVDHCVQLDPDAILLSNALLSGVLPALKQRYSGPVICLLQGDDIFLDQLPEAYRTRVIEVISERAQQFDAFFVHSDYYAKHMGQLLDLPADRLRRMTLGIDLTGHDGIPAPRHDQAFTVGYFARICPEKGLHRLVDAFRLFHRQYPQSRLRVAGYLRPGERRYFEEVLAQAEPLGAAFEHVGSPSTHTEKVAFLRSLHVLSVPTQYREPKGLYVLEALANGVPVVLPAHGAFPELVERTGGGLLCQPGDAQQLADCLGALYADDARRLALAERGQQQTRTLFNTEVMATESIAAVTELLGREEPAAQTAKLKSFS